ncbi:MAG: arylamine N-acetyltransferase [Myxococcota bacterium]
MRVVDDRELAHWVSPGEAEALCDRLGVAVRHRDLTTLRALVRAYLGTMPFQNISMLARYGRVPTTAELLEDLRRGRGGPCNAMNPFFAAVLAALGFDVSLVSGSMAQPDCHIALCIHLAGQKFWIDVGNGHPYLEPIAVGDEAIRFHAGLAYRLARHDQTWYAVQHRPHGATGWRTSYRLRFKARPLHYFASMIEHHHRQVGFGPFMTGLRLIRFPGGMLTAIRDNVLLTGRTEVQKHVLTSQDELMDTIANHFGDIELPVEAALHALVRAGCPVFGTDSLPRRAQP